MQASVSLDKFIRRFRKSIPIRASSLIITLFGDAVEPHGGEVWLGSLIHLLEPLGINERLIRTSVFRLSKEGWLSAEKSGRRSFYRITLGGRKQFDKAFRRVYNVATPNWNGAWFLVVLSRLGKDRSKQVAAVLRWEGFGEIAPGVLASPHCQRDDVMVTLRELGVADECILFETTPQTPASIDAIRQLIHQSWEIGKLAALYRDFVQLFQPLWELINTQNKQTPQDCFLIRLLLIHAYRKILLRDPQLPDELLLVDWEGHAARQLCRDMYHAVYAQAEIWLSQQLEFPNNSLSKIDPNFYRRFGGLKSIGLQD